MSIKTSSVQNTTFRRQERLSRLGILEEPMGYVEGQNLYEYVGSNPANWLDPMGEAPVKINDEWWNLPIAGDAGHPHGVTEKERSALGLAEGTHDLGPHMHGPDGQKFFPRHGVVMDKHGTKSRASNKFMKSFEDVRPRVNTKLGELGLLGLLALLALATNEACGANAEMIEGIKRDIKKLQGNAPESEKELARLGIVDSVQKMFGSDLAGLALYNKLKEYDAGPAKKEFEEAEIE